MVALRGTFTKVFLILENLGRSTKVDVSTIALRKFNFFKFLLLTILIVNVQIKGLIDAKPLWGGPTEGRDTKIPKNAEKSVFFITTSIQLNNRNTDPK